mmetsp:Transcript_38217/g.82320  ORF Transcript_38217/g.82320 Transcript_38217/m.82320 type:complete len:204 (-) Transcript_38217:363-974(-)
MLLSEDTFLNVDIPSCNGATFVRKESSMPSMTSSIFRLPPPLPSQLSSSFGASMSEARFRDAMLDGTWFAGAAGATTRVVVAGEEDDDDARCADFLPRRLNPDDDFFAGRFGAPSAAAADDGADESRPFVSFVRPVDDCASTRSSSLFSAWDAGASGSEATSPDDDVVVVVVVVVPSFPQGNTLVTSTLYRGFSHRFFRSGGS